MHDYFSDICDWKDEDDRWRPTTYQTFAGTLAIDDRQTVEYEGVERDWWGLGQTPEENLAMGHVFELAETTFGLVAWGDSLEDALGRLKRTVLAYLERSGLKENKKTP